MHCSHHKVVALKAFSTLLGVNSLAGKLLVICMQENAKEERMEKQELREAFVLRDSWTKLNVLPAKIIQVSTKFVQLHCANLIISWLTARTSSFRTVQILQAKPSPI